MGRMEAVAEETNMIYVYCVLAVIAVGLWLSAFYRVLEWLMYHPHQWILPSLNDWVSLALSVVWCMGWLFGIPYLLISEFWVKCH
jgi:hypothetical protein